MGFLFFKNKQKEGKKPSKNADASAPSARELYDLAQIRQWAGELPDEEQRAEILSAMDELERLDQAQAGGGQACLRAFLLKAARAGSEAAAQQAYWTLGRADNTDKELMEAVAYAALHGSEDCICIMQTAATRIDTDPWPHMANEFEFWEDLYDTVAFGEPEDQQPFEDRLAGWQAARRKDAQVIAKKRGAMQALLDERDALEAQVQELEDADGREEELLKAFCSLLIARDKAALFAEQNKYFLETPVHNLHTLFSYPEGREPDDWEPSIYEPEAEWAYAQGRVLEQKGKNYPKVVELYREAARLGHGEAMYRLSSLGEFWPEAAKPHKREVWAQKIRAAGWPLTGSWQLGNYLLSAENHDDPSGLLELARGGDLDAVRHLTRFLQSLWRNSKGKEEESSRYREAMLMTRVELALNRKAAETGDNEACLHLWYLYRNMDEHLWKRGETSLRKLMAVDKNLQKESGYWFRQLFQRDVELVYYLKAVLPYGLSGETAQKLADHAEALGLVGAWAGLEQWKREQQELREYERREAAAQKEAARRQRERRDALEAEMDAYRSQLDWAERAINLAAGGRDDTMLESYLRGDISLQDSARADFVRSELESAHRKKLEDAYGAGEDE